MKTYHAMVYESDGSFVVEMPELGIEILGDKDGNRFASREEALAAARGALELMQQVATNLGIEHGEISHTDLRKHGDA
jgi:predicted RNase H-like HicB family nuclease